MRLRSQAPTQQPLLNCPSLVPQILLRNIDPTHSRAIQANEHPRLPCSSHVFDWPPSDNLGLVPVQMQTPQRRRRQPASAAALAPPSPARDAEACPELRGVPLYSLRLPAAHARVRSLSCGAMLNGRCEAPLGLTGRWVAQMSLGVTLQECCCMVIPLSKR
jgi:hypothetical protein